MLANNTCWIPTRRQSLPTRVVRHDMAMSVIELAWWQMTVRWLAHLGWRVVAEQRQRRAILIGVLLGLLALAAGRRPASVFTRNDQELVLLPQACIPGAATSFRFGDRPALACFCPMAFRFGRQTGLPVQSSESVQPLLRPSSCRCAACNMGSRLTP